MDRERWAFRICMVIFVIVLTVVALWPTITNGEEETVKLFVTASQLNGRARPSKKATVEASFFKGDELKALGWSRDQKWVEVEGGETGTVWVWWEYVDEQEEDISVWWNGYGSRVRIRKTPEGRVCGYLKKDAEIEITQVVLGWGKSNRGWIDLSYLTKED